MLQRARASSRALGNCDCRKVMKIPMRCSTAWCAQVVCSVLTAPSADISELDLKKGTSINFPEGKDKLMHFEIRIQPEEGTYKYVSLVAAALLTRPHVHILYPLSAEKEPFSLTLPYQHHTLMMLLRSNARPR